MIVTVKAHEIFIAKDELVNEKEVNISNCKFKFDDEITDDFVKIAIFTKGSKSYSQVIINNECDYPAEILDSTGDCILGVVMTLSSDDRIIKRYSPIPKRFWISSGSLRTAINSEGVTASEFEQYMQALQEQLDKINDLQQNVVEQGDYAKRQGDYAKEQANSIIKANAEASEIINKFEGNVNEYTTAFDNNASEKLKSYNDNSVAKTNKFDDNYDNKVSQFNDNAVNKINDYNSNAEQKIVEYDKHSEELNNKIEEVKKATPKKVSELENDLNYVKNNDYATNAAGGVIKANVGLFVDAKGYVGVNAYDYDEYKSKTNNYFVGKGTLENVIKGKKLETANNKVTSISPNSTDEQYPSAKCTYKIKKDLETFKNGVLETGTASDTFIHVEDSALAELQELEVEGVCEQTTTTGKNLLPNKVNFQGESAGITFKLNEDGTYTINGKNNGNANSTCFLTNSSNVLHLARGTYYTIKMPMSGITMTARYAKNHEYGYIQLSGSNSDTFILDEDKDLEVYLQVYKATETTFSNVVLKPMISNEKIDDYEPYTGGEPSPSPDFPQKIKTITDSLSVTSCNKNILNNTSIYPKLSHGITITFENQTYILNGTVSGTFTNITDILNFNGSLGTYTISVDSPKDFYTNLKFLYEDGSVSQITIVRNTSYAVFTITKKIMGMYIFVSSLADGQVLKDVQLKVQLERGSTQTSFEEHIQSQITAKLPEGEFIGKINDTYKDTLSVDLQDDGKYHLILNKRIRHVKLSTNDMNLTEDFPGWGGQFVLSLTDDFPYSNMQLSEKTNYISNITNDYYGYGVNTNSPDYPQFWINSNVVFGVKMTQTEIKEKYPNLIVDLYYGIPKDNQYTVDLGTVDMPLSYNEVTNIFTDSDLLPTINAKYYRNFTKTIQNLQVNEMTLKQELININNRLSALELAKASVIDDSPSIEESEVAE